MDLTTLTDDELAAHRDEVKAEIERRRVLALADEQQSDLNRRVLEAKGETEGSEWTAPSSAVDAYPKDWEVEHNGKRWVSLTPANVWEPGKSGWREVVPTPDPNAGPPEWVQPTGAHDAYPRDSQVSHLGKVWQSTADANVWEPGVYGWDAI